MGEQDSSPGHRPRKHGLAENSEPRLRTKEPVLEGIDLRVERIQAFAIGLCLTLTAGRRRLGSCGRRRGFGGGRRCRFGRIRSSRRTRRGSLCCGWRCGWRCDCTDRTKHHRSGTNEREPRAPSNSDQQARCHDRKRNAPEATLLRCGVHEHRRRLPSWGHRHQRRAASTAFAPQSQRVASTLKSPSVARARKQTCTLATHAYVRLDPQRTPCAAVVHGHAIVHSDRRARAIRPESRAPQRRIRAPPRDQIPRSGQSAAHQEHTVGPLPVRPSIATRSRSRMHGRRAK